MKDMPLFYRFWTDRLFVLEPKGLIQGDATAFRKEITGAVKFHADAIASTYLPKQEHGPSLAMHEYGCVKPPYTRMWIEYAVPHAAETWHREASRIGHLIQTITKDEAEGLLLPLHGDEAKAHWRDHLHEIECVIMNFDVFWSRTGYLYWAGFDVHGLNMQGIRVAGFQVTPVESLAGDLWPMWYTLAMLNCKNVEMVRVDVEGQKQKDAWHKRTGCPRVKFNTVKVRGDHKRYVKHASGERESSDPMAWHTVRGHFARYTEEKPLFGKYVGQFWVPQHARGDMASGVVLKDYEVAP